MKTTQKLLMQNYLNCKGGKAILIALQNFTTNLVLIVEHVENIFSSIMLPVFLDDNRTRFKWQLMFGKSPLALV